MSANVKIEIRSPLGTVTIAQEAGRVFNAGSEIESQNVRNALTTAVMQASCAFGVRPAEIADSIVAAIAEEN